MKHVQVHALQVAVTEHLPRLATNLVMKVVHVTLGMYSMVQENAFCQPIAAVLM
jgi:hypothetical protein